MSEENWFWEKEGAQQGPSTRDELVSRLESGELGSKTLVWHEGLTDWVPADEAGLVTRPSGPPPIQRDKPTPPPAPAEKSPPGEGHLVPVESRSEAPARPARLRPDFRPRIRTCFGRAWRLMTSDFWPFVGVFTLVSLIVGVAAQLFVTVFFLMYPLLVGLNWYILNRIRRNPVTIDAIFFGFRRRFADLAVLNLVLTIPFLLIVLVFFAVLGFAFFGLASDTSGSSATDQVAIVLASGGIVSASLLLMIPFLVLSAIANFAMTLVVDCDISWKKALSLGWKATRAHLFKLILFVFLYSLIAQLGVIALYFGVFITGAWSMIAMVYLYEDAFGDEIPS